jgi:hypothetical protein
MLPTTYYRVRGTEASNSSRMHFSDDDDVSVSGSDHSDDAGEEDVSFSDVSEDDDPAGSADDDDPVQQQQQQPTAAAAAAAAGSGAAGLVAAAAKGSSRGVTDALISGEMSTQTALLQIEVRGTPGDFACLLPLTRAAEKFFSSSCCCHGMASIYRNTSF